MNPAAAIPAGKLVGRLARRLFRRRTERRNYTELRTAALVEGATGSAAVMETAAAQACAQLYARSFAAARVRSEMVNLPSIVTPSVLYETGRSLILFGEVVFTVRSADAAGMIRFERALSHDVRGTRDDIRYRVSLPSPSDEAADMLLPDSGVFHPVINAPASRPWEGRSPFLTCPVTSDLLRNLERALRDEAGTTTGQVVPSPDIGEPDGEENGIAETLGELRGKLALVPSMAAGWGEGRTGAPDDWSPRRLGAAPPAPLVELRDQVERSIYASAGVPPVLFAPQATGQSYREAWRQFLHGALQPIARIVEAELSRKLASGRPVRLDFSTLMASDIQGRARAYQSLVAAGMPPADAGRIAGFDE